MARIKNEAEFNSKRNDILDIAQRLIYTKGYEQMSIQDIVNALKISKGAFYHYFDSKPHLLNALTERTMQEAMQVIEPILRDPHLTAVEKLQTYFSSVARWKTDRKDYLMALMRVWYTDENTIVRQKTFAASLEHITPVLTAVFKQGNEEGVFQVPCAEESGQVVMAMLQGVGDTIARLMMNMDTWPGGRAAVLQQVLNTAAAYNLAIERVLGAKPNTFTLFDESTMKAWIIPQEEIEKPPIPVMQPG